MLILADNGYRCIAHDRRGTGRSTQPWGGKDLDTGADDLAAVLDTLDLRLVALIGFSTGGEVAPMDRYGVEARFAPVANATAATPSLSAASRHRLGH